MLGPKFQFYCLIWASMGGVLQCKHSKWHLIQRKTPINQFPIRAITMIMAPVWEESEWWLCACPHKDILLCPPCCLRSTVQSTALGLLFVQGPCAEPLHLSPILEENVACESPATNRIPPVNLLLTQDSFHRKRPRGGILKTEAFPQEILASEVSGP